MTSRRIPTVALLLALGACGADFWAFETDHLSGAGTTTLVVVWSDSVLDDAESVVVGLDRVEVFGPEGVEVLAAGRQVHDLLALTNGVSAEIARSEIPAGEWTGLRLLLAGDGEGPNTVRVDGVVHPLRLARPGANVVQVQHPLRLDEGAVTSVHVDFNLRRSVLAAGEGWILDPHLSAIDPTGAGRVAGRVLGPSLLGVAGATVSAQQGAGVEILSTRCDADGLFRVGPLAPGVYALVATATGHAPGRLEGIVVSAGLESGGHVVGLAEAVPGSIVGAGPPGRTDLTVGVLGPAGLVALVGVDPVTGAFVLPALAPGTYTLVLQDDAGPIEILEDVGVDAGFSTVVELG